LILIYLDLLPTLINPSLALSFFLVFEPLSLG